jgi:D-alanyl-D-alanine carboxypeptidase/D-alanyl-D-alanine-endopeptidase (penicillin-binding protein 4)
VTRVFFFILLFVHSAWAQEADLINDFSAGIKKYNVGTLDTQAFCYETKEGQQGYQLDRPQRIASLSKIFTTFFASEKLDLQKRYELKIYVTNDALHIEGGRDPYFEEEKMFLLMKALNELGYMSFKTVTMDANFFFTDESQSEYHEITPAYVLSRLAFYLNKKNRKTLAGKWSSVQNFAWEEGIDLHKIKLPQITAQKVSLVTTNPLKDLAPTVYTHRSLPLRLILKSMIVQSKNIVAQNLYLEAGALQKFTDFMVERGFKADQFVFYTGSGLPVINGNSRIDNLATCRVILRLIPLLEKSLAKHGLALSDVLAVAGGKDLGSFRSRFKRYPETNEAVLAKTGTLMQTSALSGVLLIDGKIPFAILNNSSNTSGSRVFEDYFVSRMFFHLGNPTPMDYTKISIFPWNTSEFLATAVR